MLLLYVSRTVWNSTWKSSKSYTCVYNWWRVRQQHDCTGWQSKTSSSSSCILRSWCLESRESPAVRTIFLVAPSGKWSSSKKCNTMSPTLVTSTRHFCGYHKIPIIDSMFIERGMLHNTCGFPLDAVPLLSKPGPPVRLTQLTTIISRMQRGLHVEFTV